MKEVKEIRNPSGRLICRINIVTHEIEILEKGWITVIHCNPNGTVNITHRHIAAV